MKTLSSCIYTALVTILLSGALGAADDGLAAWWKFDEGQGKSVLDHVSSVSDEIRGLTRFVGGVSGTAIKFDGFSSSIVRRANAMPRLEDAFSVEAWIALGAYPWNWAPIIAADNKRITGFYFGIDSRGNPGFHVSDGTATWHECNAQLPPGKKVNLELKKWHHVVGTFDPNSGLALYVNGRLVETYPLKERAVFARDVDLTIGRNHEPLPPTDPIRAWATYPSWYSFDGIMDEIKVYNQALTAGEVKKTFSSVKPGKDPEFAPRRFPTLEKPSGRFGANYTKLKYYEEWDNLWPVGEYTDVVVQFDELPVKVMFWRGTRYSACWVTENGKWMADQSRETGNNWFLSQGSRDDMPTGCIEHMSDTQCRSSRVSIVENNDARVMVHWRYLQMDVRFRQRDLRNQTGWGEWGDEYYYIYPDGVGVRKLLPGRGGWQETILLNEPGTRPEDNVELKACTLVNLKGKSKTYSWERGYPVFDLPDPLIQMTNLKAKFKPFMIFRTGSGMSVFNVEVRPEYSHFPWWNHWPVAQVISDGRSAYHPDRATHSSLSWGDPEGEAALYGMTDKPAVSLVDLARSWNNPPEMKITGKGFSGGDYDYTQRAYIVNADNKGSALEFELIASENSPIVNPAFVIKMWGGSDVRLTMDGREIPRGKDFRYGVEYTVTGDADLIVWIRHKSSSPVKVALKPAGT